MYLEFYRLREYPYALGCDARYFYKSRRHNEALARLLYTVQQSRGMVLLTGDVGSGKTFLGRILAGRLSRRHRVAALRHPQDTAKHLVRTLNRSVGLDGHAGTDRMALVEELERHLLGQDRRGRQLVVILDEVQSFSDEALEELRLLWNIQADGRPLLQIVLLAQPELRDRLLRPEWEALRQRIVMRFHLGPLSENETMAYILHRRKVAKDEGCRLKFTVNALKTAHRVTGGIPRLINVLCDNALLVGYARGQSTISSRIMGEVADDTLAWDREAPEGPADTTARERPATRRGGERLPLKHPKPF
jgi:general secretion pathway protein A